VDEFATDLSKALLMKTIALSATSLTSGLLMIGAISLHDASSATAETRTAALSRADRPNVLLIVADDLGYGELGCQGNPQIPTPHIDALVRGGVRFTNGYVSGPYCSPTRAGLLTGRYQQRFGHEFNPGPANAAQPNFGLSLAEKTLAERLKAADYATGMFGKWHLGFRPEYTPTRRGFDTFYGFLAGAHTYINTGAAGPNPILRDTEPVRSVTYTTDDFAHEAASFIRQHRERSWFVYLPFNAVHAPLQANAKYLSRFNHIPEAKRRTFAAMLSAMDDAVGTVMQAVRENGLDERTLVVFVSDNGGPTAQTTSSNGPLRGFKAQTWEGGIRVPFAMRWPGHIPAGKTYDRPVIQLDVVPTVLAAASIPVGDGPALDGVNLLPFLEGESPGDPHAALFWRFGRQRAVRAGDWKLTDPGDGAGARLFNLADDIGELRSLAANSAEKLQELEAAYAKWNTANIPPRWSGPATKAARAQTKAQRKAQQKKKAAGI
jgi:arylsulfatase A-like enzyme